ncbi:MAG: THUMP domain-containing protein [Saprospiraceae bacterium]
MGKNFRMVAKTMFGFEGILAKELQQLGALDIEEGLRMVSFTGDTGFMYKANLALRTAIKVLKPIYSFHANNEDKLYQGIYKFDWSEIMGVDQTLAIDATVHSEYFNHSKFIAQKTKDAIVDQFRNKFGKRPDVDIASPDLRINIHINDDHCTVSLDSSGLSLHLRGYKSSTNIAPINEVLAAGLLLHSGWEGQSHFLDPMCGSGTILIEAAMIACRIPANLHRKEFTFQKWSDWDPELYELIKSALLSKVRDFNFTIQGYDIDETAIHKSKENIENAGLEEFITLEQQDFFTSEKKHPGPLHILFNPPYGERIDVEMETFHKQIGDTLKQKYSNTHAWMITANLEALKFVGLRPSRKIKVFNGALEGRLVNYEMYEGTKKAKYNLNIPSTE